MTIPSGYSQCNMLFSGVNAPHGAECTFGVVNSSSKTPSAIATIVNAAVASAGLMTDLSVSLTYTGCKVKNGPDSTGPFATVAASINGSLGAAVLPPNVGYLLIKSTASGGRKNRGRLFLPGCAPADVNQSGVVVSSRLSALLTNWGNFLADLNTNGVPMCILHADQLTTPTPVTSFAVSNTVATQRRRLRG